MDPCEFEQNSTTPCLPPCRTDTLANQCSTCARLKTPPGPKNNEGHCAGPPRATDPQGLPTTVVFPWLRHCPVKMHMFSHAFCFFEMAHRMLRDPLTSGGRRFSMLHAQPAHCKLQDRLHGLPRRWDVLETRASRPAFLCIGSGSFRDRSGAALAPTESANNPPSCT